MQRIRAVLHDRCGHQRAERQTENRCGAVYRRSQRRMLGRLQVDGRRRERTGYDASGDSLRDASGEEPLHAGGEDEHQHARKLDRKPGQDHGPTPDRIGQRPGEQQRHQQGDRVDGEHFG